MFHTAKFYVNLTQINIWFSISSLNEKIKTKYIDFDIYCKNVQSKQNIMQNTLQTNKNITNICVRAAHVFNLFVKKK